MALNLSAASNILKVNYQGPVRQQFNAQSILYQRLRKDFKSVTGKSITIPIHTKYNLQGGTGVTDGGTLPTASQGSYSTAVVPTKYVYSRIEITGPTIAAMRNDAGAFLRALRSQVEDASISMARSLNRQLHSEGKDWLAFWTSADNTSGTTVDDGQGNAFIHLQSGETVDLIDTDNSTEHGTDLVVTVGTKNASTYDITWTGTVTSSGDADYLVLANSNGNTFQGIRGVISASDPALPTGGLHGLAVASNSFWSAQSFLNSGTNRPLSLFLMQKPLSEIVVASNAKDDDVKFLLGNVFVRDEYINLLVADKRHVNSMELDGGQRAVEFNSKPFLVDPQCRRNTIYYVTPKSMALYLMSEVEWADLDHAGNAFRNVANADSWEAFAYIYGDLGCSARNQNGVLGDLTESAS